MVQKLQKKILESPDNSLLIIPTSEKALVAKIRCSLGDHIAMNPGFSKDYSFRETLEHFDSKNGLDSSEILNSNPQRTQFISGCFRNGLTIGNDTFTTYFALYVENVGKEKLYFSEFGINPNDIDRYKHFRGENANFVPQILISTFSNKGFAQAYKKPQHNFFSEVRGFDS